MEVKEITYGQTLNRGNFQSSRLEMTVTLNEGEDVAGALDKLKAYVYNELKKEEVNKK